MSKFFIYIYDYLASHRGVMWFVLSALIIVMGVATVQLRYDENINNFFPEQQQDISTQLSNMKQSSRLVLFITSEEPDVEYDLMDRADEMIAEFETDQYFVRSVDITSFIDETIIESVTNFTYDYLPSLLDDYDYARLDSLTSTAVIEQQMQISYDRLTSAMGGFMSEYILRDPLNLGSAKLKGLEQMGQNVAYDLVDGYIFSTDHKSLMFYIDPIDDSSHAKIVECIEAKLEEFNNRYVDFKFDYFGAPAVAYHNARQIKFDSMVTLNIAILIVAIFIFMAFRRRRNVLLIMLPVLFGVLFSLTLIYLIKGSISLIAVGSGSIIFGLAFSYAIHMISHAEHSRSIYEVIRELVYPLTIGSITTIGAFVGLLFTNSILLQDLGLFASLSLIGTTLFTLIFLPQFIEVGAKDESRNRVLDLLDRITSRLHDRNLWIVWSILIFAAVSVLFFQDVRFDSDMMNLNFDPPHLQEAEQRLKRFSGHTDGESNVPLLTTASSGDEAIEYQKLLTMTLDSLNKEGVVGAVSGIESYLIDGTEQERRLTKWCEFWSEERRERVLSDVARCEEKLGFESGAFADFYKVITRDYTSIKYDEGSEIQRLFPDWIWSDDESVTIMSQVRLRDCDKERVYAALADNQGVIAVDRAYLAGMMARDVSENFYLVLYISGLLIFFVLLLSYGRLELALISFMPMGIAWIIIIGLMSIFGIEFNIVTIILSTFIFGIGDDFSIFVMDGLQGEYRDRSGVLSHHKRAIFISALSLIVGMGALIFARHPAMYSLGLISLIGMVVVVLVSYTISPLIFRWLITSHTLKGGMPCTIFSILNTIYAFGLFVFGCFGVQFIILISYIFIFNSDRRQLFIHTIVRWFINWLLQVMITVKQININPLDERFEKPAVIIANHQSFIDILMLLALNRKLVMVTNSWVWNNPFFGPIVRFFGFFHTADGYENAIPVLRRKVELGYSIIIFPEGTRSVDSSIKRFHKGAFYIAEMLHLDILPILIYGSGLVSSKSVPFYIKYGQLVTKILPRISPTAVEYGEGYKERGKSIYRYFKSEYNNLYEEYNRASNPHFRDAIIKNYIYKGPILEWYMRIKLHIEGWYDLYDRLVPRDGYIVDLGCGYGAMSYMLMLLSKRRRITAIDYDEDKIAVAQCSYLKEPRIEFESGDIRKYDTPQADCYIISDVLHYVDYDSQREIIERCISRLNRGGVLIIRDGDSSQEQSHHNTEATEMWSTKYLKFNKSEGQLYFLSGDMLRDIAVNCGMNIEVVKSERNTSNRLFVISHKL